MLRDSAKEAVVVCGHTHMLFDRTVGDTRVVNAGSVGMPFGNSGTSGAAWMSRLTRLRAEGRLSRLRRFWCVPSSSPYSFAECQAARSELARRPAMNSNDDKL